MKFKFPILIATGLLITFVSKAQYGAPCTDNRVVIQAHIGFPAPVPVVYNQGYNYASRERYDDRRDWRAEQYERYCRENRGHRMGREQFYREHCDYRTNPYYSQRKVVEYRRY